ncbi:hypothetical protein Nps_00225 [Candidatus Nanopusillus acidilobi]|nr:hypothetical protein Nps_00225 [Candidatus Nanopusillus acidilobi]
MKSISDSVIELIIVIIIIIFVILVFFNVLKGLSYAGRPEAKFGYALSGSISFMVNPIAQGISDASTIANDVLIGIIAATAVAGIVKGVYENYNANIEYLESIGFSEEDIQNMDLKDLLFEDLQNGGSALGPIAKDVINSYRTVFLNPLGGGLLFGTIGLDLSSESLNNLAHALQGPILYYLVPEGLVVVNLSNIGGSQINEMLNDLNQSYVNNIEQQQYCSNPTSSACQNLYATYLVAKYLFYTYGETLGQSVTIAGNHNEYVLLLFDYNSTYNVTLNDVLCMLEMMKYYNYIPLEVMYGDKVIANSTNNIACQILSNVNSSLMSENPQDSNNVYNKLLVNSFEVNNSSGKPYLLSSTKNNPSPNQVTIIPGNLTLPNGIIIEYTYEGGNRVILLTSISGGS